MVLVICILAILFFILGTLFDPFLGLIAFTITLYFKLAGLNPIFYQMHITRLFGLLIFVLILLKGKKEINFSLFKNKQSKLFFLFFSVLCFSVVTSIWRSVSIDKIGAFSKIVIAYFILITLVTTPKRLKILVNTMILCMLTTVAFSINNHYVSGAIYSGARMYGAFYWALFYDPNDISLGILLLIPFLYYNLANKRNFLVKIASIAIIGIFLWGLILTQSRGGFLSLLAMTLFIFIKSKRKIMLFLLGGILLVSLWTVAPQSFKDRMITIDTAAENDGAAQLRIFAWRASFNMMKSRLFGVGAGNFREGYAIYRPADATDNRLSRRVAHNMFLEIGGETGLIGLFLFCGFIFSAFKSLSTLKRNLINSNTSAQKELIILIDSTFVSLVGYCSAGIFLSQNYNFILYYLIGFSVSLENIYKNEQSK